MLISTDIGGTDPDDFQSLIHYLMYADLFDTEALISSPPGDGRKSDILRIVDSYARDHAKLKRHSEHFPTPDALRAVTMQGAIDRAPLKGWREPTEGSRWIVHCAMKDDPRPLYVLVWGGIDDVAQALHDEPAIRGRIRVYFIGGPNKKWSADAYDYIQRNFPDLWMIENNSTYRGWFVGGKQEGELGNRGFYERHIKGRSALGAEFGRHYQGELKMGDTPSVAYLLHGNPDDPQDQSWGGSFVRAGPRPKRVFQRPTTHADVVETFQVIEWELSGPDAGKAGSDEPSFQLEIDGQRFGGYRDGRGVYRVRFVPKSSGAWNYTIRSPIRELDGRTGRFTSVDPSPTRGGDPGSSGHWWIDRPEPEWREGPHQGARTINRWREDYLRDWSRRLAWLAED